MTGKGGILDTMLEQIKTQVKDTLIAPHIQSAIDRGAARVKKKMGGDADSAVDDMNKRAQEAQQDMKDYQSKDKPKGDNASKPKNDPAGDMGLPDKNGVRNHKSPVTDAPKDTPSLEVKYNGEKTTLGEVRNRDVENDGIKLVRGKDGDLHVVRKDYPSHVKGSFDAKKRTNRYELAAFAETSGLNITVKDFDGKVIEKLNSNSGGKTGCEMVRLKDRGGRYVLVKAGTMTPVKGFEGSVGCGPQMVYLEARAAGKTREEALALAKDPAKVEEYLARAKDVAAASPELKDMYDGNDGKSKKKGDDEDDKKDDKTDDGKDENKDENKDDKDDQDTETPGSDEDDGGLDEKKKKSKDALIDFFLESAKPGGTWNEIADKVLTGELVYEELQP